MQAASRQVTKQTVSSVQSRYQVACRVQMLGSFFWDNPDVLMGKLKKAESKLMEYAKTFGDRASDDNSLQMTTHDTPIPSKALPFNRENVLTNDLSIHSLRVTTTTTTEDENANANADADANADANANANAHNISSISKKHPTPLVILHGYMNGALYFYRNVVGLSNYFQTVYSLDTPGCGLSSRNPGLLSHVDKTVEATEAFFVESLEAWRKANDVDKMILAGHSMGGYISIAYCEKYPERVEQLVLLSPVGVPKEDEEKTKAFVNRMSWTRRSVVNSVRYLFEFGVTPAGFSRRLPSARSRSMIESYVQGRLPVITDPLEQQSVIDYLYYLAMVPGFGEDMLSRILTSTANARKPTVDRIPKLGVKKVSFLYGDRDWMDIQGGISVYEQCKLQGNENGPDIEVYQLQDAGHLLMVDNWRGMNAGVVAMCGGISTLSPHYPMPLLVRSTLVSSPSLSSSSSSS
ncbi:unnamed protein product [Cylindrotheca closterium]|uniref:AB hydrolase-1 domain-containing protein n=1 Tax=Cylindrotheca closterium TaxID=2856 RepID=A0AAD2G766_9STRA|nr:unnamed protein product [Cylindrotheca closterium]